MYLAKFRNCEQELQNTLAASKSKAGDLEIPVREAESGG
jgi:hypothetical protein